MIIREGDDGAESQRQTGAMANLTGSRTLSAPQLTVDLDALAANVAVLRGRARGLVAVVKADAFGHGDVAAHLLAHGADWLGTTSLDHAVALRRTTGARTLAWLTSPTASFDDAVDAGVDVAVPSIAHLHAVAASAAAVGTPARVHLHIDLGMSRDGAPPESWPALADAAASLVTQGLVEPVGVMGHLSHAAQPDDPRNARALLAFEAEWRRHAGAKEEAIRVELGLSPARYYQLLGRLIDTVEALEHDPMLVKRLRRVRDARDEARLGRASHAAR